MVVPSVHGRSRRAWSSIIRSEHHWPTWVQILKAFGLKPKLPRATEELSVIKEHMAELERNVSTLATPVSPAHRYHQQVQHQARHVPLMRSYSCIRTGHSYIGRTLCILLCFQVEAEPGLSWQVLGDNHRLCVVGKWVDLNEDMVRGTEYF